MSLLAEEFDSFSRSDSSFIHAKDNFFVVIQLHMRHSLDSLQYRDTAWWHLCQVVWLPKAAEKWSWRCWECEDLVCCGAEPSCHFMSKFFMSSIQVLTMKDLLARTFSCCQVHQTLPLDRGKKQQEGFVAFPGVVQCAALPSSPGRGWISRPWDLAVTVPNWPLEISRGK